MIQETTVERLSVAPVIAGLSFRRLRSPQDYPAMTATINAANVEDGVDEVESVEEVAGTRQYWHLAYLDPAYRRRGLGRAMLHWNEQRLLQIVKVQTPASESFYQVWTQDTARGKNILLEQEGYRPARYFHFMQRKGLDDLPEFSLLPGIELRPVLPEHLRRVWEAKEEAFADHWGYTPKSEADYQSWANDPGHDYDLWMVAWEGDQVVGTSLSFIYPEDNSRFGFLRGEIRTVAVRRPWRGRGLGRALMIASLQALRRRGMTEAVLGVDSDSQTGALHLYESIGFRTIAQDMVMRKAFP